MTAWWYTVLTQNVVKSVQFDVLVCVLVPLGSLRADGTHFGFSMWWFSAVPGQDWDPYFFAFNAAISASSFAFSAASSSSVMSSSVLVNTSRRSTRLPVIFAMTSTARIDADQ